MSKPTVESFDYQWRTLPTGDFLLSDRKWRQNVDAYILDELALPRNRVRGLKVLDAGCGQGRWSYGFEKLGCQVHGFDTSPSAVKYARKHIRGKFDVVDILSAEQLDDAYDGMKFDIVWCFPKGTFVYGSRPRPIELIKAGESVGDQRVVRTFSRDYEGRLIVLKVLGLPEIRVTPEHEILVTRFKYVHRKRKGKFVHKEVYQYQEQEVVWKPAKDVDIGDWVIVPIEKKEEEHSIRIRKGFKTNYAKRVSERIEVDSDMAKAIGLWVAEGHLARAGYNIWYTFGKDESGLVNELNRILTSNGFKTHVYARPTPKNTISLVTSNKDLWNYLRRNFGVGARSKRIPEWLYKARNDVIRGFIEGLWQGDGSLDRREIMMHICTASKQLGLGLLPLFYKLGITASAQREVQSTTNDHNTEYWRLYFSRRAWEGKPDKRGREQTLRSKSDGTFMFLPIQHTSQEEAKCRLYNLETTNNVYRVPFIVHNCWGVLHHTPDPKRGFDNLTSLLAPKGMIHIYVYGMKGPVSRLWRWIFGRFGLANKERLSKAISRVGFWLQRVFSRKNLPVAGRLLRRIFPAYTPHTIFDAFSPRIASEHSQGEVRGWFQSNGLRVVFHRPSWGGSKTSTDIWATGWKR